MSSALPPRRPVRIANVSGATGDGPLALHRVVREGPVDVVTADYLAEANLTWLATEKKKDPSAGYEPGFLRQLDRETARIIAARGIKVVHNGGALNPAALAAEVRRLLASYGVEGLRVAHVEGDDVMGMLADGRLADAAHLDVGGRRLSHLDKPVLSANAYVGMGGIVAALSMGAEVVICGRCCDASPVMGAAAWWHGWAEDDYDALAGALIAGHCIECGTYATGGNFSGFKSIPQNWAQGFPVAEIARDGTFDVTLQEGSPRGLVSTDTVTAQLVYEIQGPLYLNPDVVADMRNVAIESRGKNRVAVSGITGAPPPPTTKLAVCTEAGFQVEYYFFAAGLDAAAKAAHLRATLDSPDVVPNRRDYAVLRVDQYGVAQPDAPSQALATVTLRVFAQAARAETLATLRRAVGGFCVLGGYAGLHMCMDFRLLAPRPFVSYEPFLMPYADVSLSVHMNTAAAPTTVRPPKKTQPFNGQPLCTDEPFTATTTADDHGATVRAPLGARFHARSGDKGSNANVGFWAAADDEHAWLRAHLTADRLRLLLGDEARRRDGTLYEIERFEMPRIRCVHFLVRGVLDGGVSSTWRLDGLAKSFGEFLRARLVDMPKKFVERGDVSSTDSSRTIAPHL